MALGRSRPASGEGAFRALLAAARGGSAEALGRLLEMFRPYLLSIGNERIDGELRRKAAPSDLVQQTFLEAQRDFSGFGGTTEGELLAWMRQILLNNLANLRRHYWGTDKRALQRELALSDVDVDALRGPRQADSPSSLARAREFDAALEKALAQLAEPSRLAIQYRNYERCSFEEIGRRLGRSAEAARKLWARAIDQLQQLLEPDDASS